MFPPYEVPEEIRKRLMGENSIANQAIDSTQLPPSPGEQTEAADEAIDTTTNAHTPPAVAPAPDTPPEVAIANSQTNQQASGETPAAVPPEPRPETANGLPVVHMPENPAARMAPKPAQQGTPRAPPPEPPVNGVQPTSPGAAPGAPPEPGFYERGAALLAARARDRENVNRWNLGEGLKEAFAIARGQHYGGKHYGGPLEEAGVEKDQASSLAQIRDYLARQRQQQEDVIKNRNTEQDTALKRAEELKALRPPEPKPVKPEDFNAADAKAAMKASPGMVDAIKRKTGAKDDKAVAAYIDGLPNSKDAFELAAKDLENEAQGKRAEGRGITIGIAGAQAGFGKEEATKQSEERFKINTTRRQVDGVEQAFQQVPWQDVAAGKVGWDSGPVLNFKAQAQAAIDMLARVETGASGRESQIQQWKAIINSPSVVSNDKMAAVASGLREALNSAEAENEKRTEGLPVQIGKKAQPTKQAVPVKKTITMRFPDGHEEEVDE